MTNPDQTPPPVGEEIHLPGPSLLPILNALGITLALIGITLGLVLVVVGGTLFVVTTWMWIASTRRDIAALPPEHQSH
jgi:mannose/fructose/N-acetylgalactosamine-specific phosphotransferase system component IID